MPTAPQRFMLSSLDEVRAHQTELRDIRPYITKEFALIVFADTTRYINHVFHPGVPYRMDNYRFIFFRHAKAHGVINLRRRDIVDNTVAFVSPGSIVQIDKVEAATDISAVVLDEDYIKMVMGGRLPLALNGSLRDFYLQVQPEVMEMCLRMLGLLRVLVDEKDYSQDTVGSLFAALVNYVSSLYVRQAAEQPRTASRSQTVFNQFIQLVNEHGAREHVIGFYADRLCMTERYLGSIIKKESGLSAKEWIDRAIMAEAKVTLKHSDVTIAELSERLAFPNPSLFCRWFKRMEGVTPGEYRQPG